jgi:hypothetical protein
MINGIKWKLTSERQKQINELYADLGQKPVASSSSGVVTTSEADAHSERSHV